jgi:long-chain acyl-CoA synthetase
MAWLARALSVLLSPPRGVLRLGIPDMIGSAEARTVWGLLCERVRRTPEAVAYRDFDAASGTWRDHTWHAMARRVDRFRAALAGEGLAPGERIAVLLPNGIDWVAFDLAAHGSGLVLVALYPHDSAANHAYILEHAQARLVLVDTTERWQALCAHGPAPGSLQTAWIRDGVAPAPANAWGTSLRALSDVIATEAEPPSASPGQPNALATLVYTSGTTGRPKGVMLSHFALLWNTEATARVIPPRRDDLFLSILPSAHAFERTVGYYLAMMGGSTIAFARSAQELRHDLIAVRPTVLIGVPRLFERMQAAILAGVAGNAVKRALLNLTASLGWRRVAAAQRKRRADLAVRLLWPVLERLVAARVLAAFGGRLRVAVSGGAPLDESVARFLLGVGLPLVEGYGLTEAAPVVTATMLGEYVPGSAGRPLAGVEVKLTGEGELLVRSPAMMLGYWRDEARTAGALDAEGWLATGDLAAIEDGRVFVRGRLHEMIVLSIGEKINPNAIESEITRDPLFAQAAVVGNGRPFPVALVVLDRAAWQRFARDHAADPERLNAPDVKAQIVARLQACLAAYPRYAQIRAVHLTLSPWTIEAGLLTPTLKIRREALQQLFAKEIEALYRRG